MKRLLSLFADFFRISLFVIGGGYAIAAVADEHFARKRRWLKVGEIVDHLPLIASIPGLIAGNTAIYTGLRVAGRKGALAALAGVALPSYLLFSAVSLGLDSLPTGIPWLEAAFLGLRSSLTGIVLATLWRMLSRASVPMTAAGLKLEPLTSRARLIAALALLPVLALAAGFAFESLVAFLGFGCLCIGGGFPLVPVYMQVFVGDCAPLLAMRPEDFSNLMALTQLTPGPISVNAATYFGYRLNGLWGGAVATAALLTPSYFFMTAALGSLARGGGRGFWAVAQPVMRTLAAALMLYAAWKFALTSIWNGGVFQPLALAVAVLAFLAILFRRLPIMAIILLSAVALPLARLLI